MIIPRHALTEDAVDRYNHSWGVVLLLTISASTWLLPQLSYFQQSVGEDVAMNRYRANCWLRYHFTSSQIAYIQTYCAAAFSRALRNVDEFTTETTETARIYSSVSGRKIIFRPKSTDEMGKPDHNSQPSMNRIYLRLPVITFVLAVCLQVPYIIWALLSSFSGTGFIQVLRSLKDAQLTGADIQNQEIIQAISSKRPQSSCTVMFLCFKLFAVAVPIAGFCYVIFELVSASSVIDNLNSVLFCEVLFHQFPTDATETFQCLFTSENDFMFPRPYDSIHMILAVFFALLAAVNIVNVTGWIIKLKPGPYRNGTFSNNNLPIDVYLLLYMARQNVGFLAARNLERSFSSQSRSKTKTGKESRHLSG